MYPSNGNFSHHMKPDRITSQANKWTQQTTNRLLMPLFPQWVRPHYETLQFRDYKDRAAGALLPEHWFDARYGVELKNIDIAFPVYVQIPARFHFLKPGIDTVVHGERYVDIPLHDTSTADIDVPCDMLGREFYSRLTNSIEHLKQPPLVKFPNYKAFAVHFRMMRTSIPYNWINAPPEAIDQFVANEQRGQNSFEVESDLYNHPTTPTLSMRISVAYFSVFEATLMFEHEEDAILFAFEQHETLSATS